MSRPSIELAELPDEENHGEMVSLDSDGVDSLAWQVSKDCPSIHSPSMSPMHQARSSTRYFQRPTQRVEPSPTLPWEFVLALDLFGSPTSLWWPRRAWAYMMSLLAATTSCHLPLYFILLPNRKPEQSAQLCGALLAFTHTTCSVYIAVFLAPSILQQAVTLDARSKKVLRSACAWIAVLLVFETVVELLKPSMVVILPHGWHEVGRVVFVISCWSVRSTQLLLISVTCEGLRSELRDFLMVFAQSEGDIGPKFEEFARSVNVVNKRWDVWLAILALCNLRVLAYFKAGKHHEQQHIFWHYVSLCLFLVCQFVPLAIFNSEMERATRALADVLAASEDPQVMMILILIKTRRPLVRMAGLIKITPKKLLVSFIFMVLSKLAFALMSSRKADLGCAAKHK